MKRIGTVIVGAALAALLAGPAMAQNAKVGADMGDLNLTTTGSFNEILALNVRVPSQESLVFHVSIECGIYTRTLARSKGGKKDTQGSAAEVDINVEVRDLLGNHVMWAEPGGENGVTFCSRSQELSATLQGIIENLACFRDDDGDPETPEVFDPDAPGCQLTEEEIELVLQTLNANAFNFTTPESLSSGDYTIAVGAQLLCDNDGDGTVDGDCPGGSSADDWEASALVGKGSLIVDEVRFGNIPN